MFYYACVWYLWFSWHRKTFDDFVHQWFRIIIRRGISVQIFMTIRLPHQKIIEKKPSKKKNCDSMKNIIVEVIFQIWAGLFQRYISQEIFSEYLWISTLQLQTIPNISNHTAWKVSVFGVNLVRIFAHSDWIRGDTPSLRIHSECGKMTTRITPNTDTFRVASAVREVQ